MQVVDLYGQDDSSKFPTYFFKEVDVASGTCQWWEKAGCHLWVMRCAIVGAIDKEDNLQ